MARVDPTPAIVATLTRDTQLLAIKLVNALRAQKVPLIVTSGRRTAAEQTILINAGLSLNPKSYHLTGQAFDVDVMGVSRSRLTKDFLNYLGALGESYGLRWGGRFRLLWDPGHFEK